MRLQLFDVESIKSTREDLGGLGGASSVFEVTIREKSGRTLTIEAFTRHKPEHSIEGDILTTKKD